jgi:hypothetical protein
MYDALLRNLFFINYLMPLTSTQPDRSFGTGTGAGDKGGPGLVLARDDLRVHIAHVASGMIYWSGML